MGKTTIVGAVTVAVVAAGLLVLNGPVALADHQGGTTGPGGSTEANNDLHCGSSPLVTGVYVSSRGIEVCQDGTNPIIPSVSLAQFRLIASSDGGGYIAYDGDRNNNPPLLNGAFGRVALDTSGGGSHLILDIDCSGTSNANADSTDPSNGSYANCQQGALPLPI